MPNDTDALITSWMLAVHDKSDSTRKGYEERLRPFARDLPDGVGLLDVTERHCQEYFAALKARGLEQDTRRSYWIPLRSFYGWAHAEGEIDVNPMANIKVARGNPKPKRPPDDDDLARLFKVCAGREFAQRRDLAMIRLAAATGMRVAELRGLRVEDVDLTTRLVVIRHGKGDRPRVARMDPETAAAVDRYLRARARSKFANRPELWLARAGAYKKKGVQDMLRRRCEQAGIKRIGWHALRHRYADVGQRRGMSAADMMTLGGWEDFETFRRYGASAKVDRALDAYDDAGGVL